VMNCDVSKEDLRTLQIIQIETKHSKTVKMEW